MPESIESKEFELQAFRDEIKKLKDTNDSLRLGVPNPDELGEEELEVWTRFKELFNLIDPVLQGCQTIEEVQGSEQLKSLLGELRNLAASSEKYFNNNDIVKNENRKEFLAFTRNRLELIGFLSILFPEDKGYDEENKEDDLVYAKNWMIKKRKDLGIK